jgi:hypothetical protein
VISFAPLVGAALFGAILPCKDEFGSYCKSADPILLLAAGAVATILGLLLVHRKFFSERGARVNRQGAAQGERPITMFTGPPSPSSGKEYRDAIVSRLSPGEQLVSFADCFEPMWWIPDNGSAWTCTGGTWYFLALTNINIRQGTWVFTQHIETKGFWKTKWEGQSITIAPTPAIRTMSAIALGDIVRTTDSRIAIDHMIARQMHLFLSKAMRQSPELECVQLALTLTNGDSINIGSPFVEINQLVKDIYAAKSGALVVKNTTAAADALDQLVPLLRDRILTQEEFDRAKDGFLGATVEVRESSVGLLRQLHSLHKSGVLTESEFNLKKWNILSKDE